MNKTKYHRYNNAINSAMTNAVKTLRAILDDDDDVISIINDAIWYSTNEKTPHVNDVLCAYANMDGYKDIVKAFYIIYQTANMCLTGKSLGYLPKRYSIEIKTPPAKFKI